MHWNHRVLKEVTETLFGQPETTYRFVEVYYEDDGTPSSYSEPFLLGDNIEELQSLAARLAKACDQPVLDASEFPDTPDTLEDTDPFCDFNP
jgi:hypothetical protein